MALCKWCSSKLGSVRCSRCKIVSYCSRTCQRLDWSLHKIECRPASLQHLSPTQQPSEGANHLDLEIFRALSQIDTFERNRASARDMAFRLLESDIAECDGERFAELLALLHQCWAQFQQSSLKMVRRPAVEEWEGQILTLSLRLVKEALDSSREQQGRRFSAQWEETIGDILEYVSRLPYNASSNLAIESLYTLRDLHDYFEKIGDHRKREILRRFLGEIILHPDSKHTDLRMWSLKNGADPAYMEVYGNISQELRNRGEVEDGFILQSSDVDAHVCKVLNMKTHFPYANWHGMGSDLRCHLLENSTHLHLLHILWWRIDPLLTGRGIEDKEWAHDLLNMALPLLKIDWTESLSRTGELNSQVGRTLESVIDIMHRLTTESFGKLDKDAVDAINDLEVAVQGCTLSPFRLDHLSSLRTFRAQLAVTSSHYIESLQQDVAAQLLTKLSDGDDARSLFPVLMQIGAWGLRSDSRNLLLRKGVAKSLVSFIEKCAAAPYAEAKHFIPEGGNSSNATWRVFDHSDPILVNALNKCLLAYSSSEEGLQALADAGVLASIATLLESSSKIDPLTSSQWGLCMWRYRSEDNLFSTCLKIAKALLPAARKKQKSIYLRIRNSAGMQLQSESIAYRVSYDSCVVGIAVQELMTMATQHFRHGQCAHTSIEIRKGSIKPALKSLSKRCSGPDCEAVETDTKFRLCSGCQCVAYCSRDCQKAHWILGHKQACMDLKK